MGIGKGLFDTLLDPVVRQCIRHVGGIVLAGTANEEADDTTVAFSNDGTRIPWGGESAVEEDPLAITIFAEVDTSRSLN